MFIGLLVAAAVVPAVYVAAEWSKVNASAKRVLGAEPELFPAIRESDVAGVKAILNARPESIAEQDPMGRTPLLYAESVGELEIVDLLLDCGGGVNDIDSGGRTPLWWAAFLEQPEMIRLLASRGGDPDVADEKGKTPLAIAIEMGNERAVRALLTQRSRRTVAALDLN